MQTDQYTFEDKVITLIDGEMDLHFQELFDPVRIPEKRSPYQSLPDEHILTCIGPINNLQEVWVPEKDGKWDGQYLIFYSNGHIKLESFYLLGLLHGPSTFYSETGSHLSQSWFIKGKQQGKSWYYYPNEIIYSIQRFFDGQWHGKQEFFYINGKPKTVLTYVYGKLEGPALLYNPEGDLQEKR